MKKIILAAGSAALLAASAPAFAEEAPAAFTDSASCIAAVTALSKDASEGKIPAGVVKAQTANATKMFGLCATGKLAEAGKLNADIQAAIKAAKAPAPAKAK